jgi:GrpB-like predicted nucleotidyltransferase (UPF0157 family)
MTFIRAGPSPAPFRGSGSNLDESDQMSMRVTVVPFDPRWADAFAQAQREVTLVLSSNLLQLHHIGSTAIPGIYAKPIIDMLAVVSDLEELDAQSPMMKAIGFEPMGEFGIPTRRYFRRNDSDGTRTHQIHAFQIGSPHITRHLAFRDFLRAQPLLAIQYSELKRRLASEYPNDIEAYMDGKDAFIKETEAAALAWLLG